MREYFIIPCIDIYNIVSKKNTIKTAHSKVTFYYDLQEVLCYLGNKRSTIRTSFQKRIELCLFTQSSQG